MAEVIGFLPPTGDTQIEFLSASFGPGLVLAGVNQRRDLSLSLYVFHIKKFLEFFLGNKTTSNIYFDAKIFKALAYGVLQKTGGNAYYEKTRRHGFNFVCTK